MTPETAALRELADVIDLIDQLGAQLECAWLRHEELIEVVSGIHKLQRRALDKALDKGLDKVRHPDWASTPAPLASAPSAKPAVVVALPRARSNAKHAKRHPDETIAGAILAFLAERERASGAEVIEAVVTARAATRLAVYERLKKLASSGQIQRLDRGLYSLPNSKDLAKANGQKLNAGA